MNEIDRMFITPHNGSSLLFRCQMAPWNAQGTLITNKGSSTMIVSAGCYRLRTTLQAIQALHGLPCHQVQPNGEAQQAG
jgi:hypothetical protein